MPQSITNLIVHNPSGSPLIDYRKIQPLQEDFKDFYKSDFDRLTLNILGDPEKGIEGLGWNFVFYIWFDPQDGTPYSLDGHGRNRWLRYMNARPFKLPYVEVEARDRQHALKLLFAADQRFQTATQEGLDSLAALIDAPEWMESAVDYKGLFTRIPDLPAFNDEMNDFDWPEDGAPQFEKGASKTQDDGYEAKKWEEIETNLQPGDVIEIGPHRLVCGDATKVEDVLKCLNGGKPALMVTDPPYGVEYNANWRAEETSGKFNPNHERATIKVENDARADWSAAFKLAPSKIFYCWHASLHTAEVFQSIVNSGFDIRASIIWVKTRLVVSRGHYHWQHEPAWYAVRKGDTASWIGDRSQSTVWQIDHKKSETGHSTQKPVEAFGNAIQNHEGDVYDPFAGSGTALIAAQQLGRRAYMIEIVPQACQLIINRALRFNHEFEVKINGQPYIAPEAAPSAS